MDTTSKKHICAALLAHVDAGKTTLSEAMLYLSGSIRTLGRVDNRNAFLDTFELERERGITIFSKQARLSFGVTEMTLLDTPGHVDFSAETERTLQVLDYAVLVISGADGVQGHTETLWRLLARYQVPTFLFVNKMDQDAADAEALLQELKQRLGGECIDFTMAENERREDFLENIAVCDEELLEMYLETGDVAEADIARLISRRKIFPCYFGSALKLTGVETFMEGLNRYTCEKEYPKDFGAKVYKIARDEQGNRLTYLKVTGGTLKVKEMLQEEKVNQIRLYSGAKYEMAGAVTAGMVCAVTGPENTFPGQGIGSEPASEMPVLEPVLTYRIELPEDCNVHDMFRRLRELEEEEPLLHIVWDEHLGEIQVQLMGEVQIEILKRLIWERFHVRVEFGTGNIVYKETIGAPVEGVGHFEPLRHYAEVQLLLEPGEQGSGLQFFSTCSEDVLGRNWQRLVLTHLEEREHRGVLTGSAITDMRITLLAGRAHQKHTEGGDFRQATFRAVRQGLKKAESILLEPFYRYRLEVPSEMAGRALSDIQRMNGTFTTPIPRGDMSVLTGTAPVSLMRNYQMEMVAYTGGRGRLSCMPGGYQPCHNTEEVVTQMGYDSERDLEQPTGSVFCAHGAGFVVKWDEVESYMHLEKEHVPMPEEEESAVISYPSRGGTAGIHLSVEEEKELDKMAEVSRQKRFQAEVKRRSFDRKESTLPRKKEKQKEYLLVDGYNIIFAWEELKSLAETNMDGARGMLMDILSNYQGVKKCTLILVFDAYKVEGFPGEMQKYHNIYVVYTKEAETADQYIEKTAHEIGRKYNVTVATSDGIEQVIIRGQGCHLLSAQELKTEVELVNREIRETLQKRPGNSRNYLFHYLDEETAKEMEDVRLGREKAAGSQKGGKHGGQI